MVLLVPIIYRNVQRCCFGIRHLGSWQKFHEHDAFAERAAQLRPAESPVATGPHASWLDEWLPVMPIYSSSGMRT